MLLARLGSSSVTVFWEMRLSNVEKEKQTALNGLHICRTTHLTRNVQRNDVLSYGSAVNILLGWFFHNPDILETLL